AAGHALWLMGIVVWFVIGGVLGWMTSIIADANRQRGVAVYVLVGVTGALLGGMVLSPLIGLGEIDNYGLSFPSLLISIGGAVLLLALVSRLRRSPKKTRRKKLLY
ncbi:MAG: GlsB/YeaQ/YmgE family stress response membrane protein, partial [Steroidobacteraceae bacterium]